MEKWKNIKGYEGLYQVSNLGNVRSLNYRKQGFVKNLYLKHHPDGYRQVELFKNGTKRMITVHRLVAEAFVPNRNGYDVVNHLNENKADNRVENLEWIDFAGNVRYSKNKHRNENKNKSLKRNERVLQLSLDGVLIKEWANITEVKHSTKYNNWSIYQCCEGVRKSAYGFKWQYATSKYQQRS